MKYPVAIYSRQLRGPEQRYTATELEALALVSMIKHFAHYLWGKQFTVITDYSALTSLMSSRALNRRLQNWALQLQDYQFEMKYRPGRQNLDADALSRQNWTTTQLKDGPSTHQGGMWDCGPIVSLTALEEGNSRGAVGELSDRQE